MWLTSLKELRGLHHEEPLDLFSERIVINLDPRRTPLTPNLTQGKQAESNDNKEETQEVRRGRRDEGCERKIWNHQT